MQVTRRGTGSQRFELPKQATVIDSRSHRLKYPEISLYERCLLASNENIEACSSVAARFILFYCCLNWSITLESINIFIRSLFPAIDCPFTNAAE